MSSTDPGTWDEADNQQQEELDPCQEATAGADLGDEQQETGGRDPNPSPEPRIASPPMGAYTAVGINNATDLSAVARIIAHAPRELAVSTDKSPQVRSGVIYGITPHGSLSQVRGLQIALDAGRHYSAAIAASATEHGRYLKDLLRDAAKMLSGRGIDAAEKHLAGYLAQLPLPRELTQLTHDRIDSDTTVIGTSSGVVLLSDRPEILPPHEALERAVAATTGVEWVPGASHPVVDAVLPPWDSMEAYSEPWWRGVALSVSIRTLPARLILVELCAKGTGKSTWRGIVRGALGDYASTMASDELARRERPGGGSEHNGGLLAIRPARVCILSEFETRASSRLLREISGGEEVWVRQIRGAGSMLKPTAHLWIQGNLPEEATEEAAAASLGMHGDGDSAAAVRDRVRMLVRSGLADPNPSLLREAISPSPAVRVAALARIIEYCAAYRPQDLPPPDDAQREAAEAQAQREEPPLHRWLREQVLPADGEFLPSLRLLRDAQQAMGNRTTQTAVGRAMTKVHGAQSRHSTDRTQRGYLGFRLIS